MQVIDVLEDDGAALVLQQLRRGRRGFEHRAIGRKVAAQHGDTAVRLERFLDRGDHRFVVIDSVPGVVPQRPAVDRERFLVEVFADFADHDRQAARIVEIFHQVLARGHQVHEGMHAAAELVEIFERELDADAPRDRG